MALNPTLQQNAQVLTNTSTVNELGEVLTDVSIIPFMRALPIDFIGFKLRPDRQVWFYFDDGLISVDKLIQRPNIIEVTTRNTVNDMRTGPQRLLRIGTNNARILHVERDIDSTNTIFYVSEFRSGNAAVVSGNTVYVDTVSYTTQVYNYQHFSGLLQTGSSNNELILSSDANCRDEDWYVGNTICIVNGVNAGQSAEIVSYNCLTRRAYVEPTLKIDSRQAGLIYTIGDARSNYESNVYPSSYTTSRGIVSGVLHIPDPKKNPQAKFRTGEKLFRIVDNPYFNVNHPEFGTGYITTKAEYRFVANGLNLDKAQIIEITITPTPPPPSPSATRTQTPKATPTPTSTSISNTPAKTTTPTVTPPRTSPPVTAPITVTPTNTPPKTSPRGTPSPSKSSTPPKTPPVTKTRTPAVPKSSPACKPKYTVYKDVGARCISCCPPPNGSGTSSGCCFLPDTMIRMSDGTLKPIVQIAIGDKVLSRDDKISKVTDIIITKLGNRKLYGIAGREPFATEDHPFLTNKGWTSHVIGEYHDHLVKDNVPNINWDPMTNEEQVLSTEGFVPVEEIVTAEADANTTVYALSLDGGADNTYWAENLLTHNKKGDPIAQSFYVSGSEYKDGIFISSVDLFFRNRGTILPLEMQIRPVVNGIPSSDQIIPGAITTVDIEDVVTTALPNAANSLTATRFTFPSPVYLSPTYEYAIVVVTDDFGYDYYSSDLGGTVLGTDRKVSKQPYLGSFFKSQSGTTWTPLQSEDLMFVINKCRFTATSGTAVFEEDKVQLIKELSSANIDYDAFDTIRSNTYYDAVELRSDAIQLPSTQLKYYFKGAANTSRVLDTAYTNFKPDSRYDLTKRNILFDPQLVNKSMLLRVDLSTKNQDVSPMLFHNRQNMVLIENIINDTGLTVDRFVITNPGQDYDTDNAYITIESTTGYGANAWAVADEETGNIVSVVVDSAGSGYVDDVIITVGGGAGTGATINVSTETDTSGGPALARYISKTVTLMDGFDAGDLRVFLTAVKPPTSNVNVYYKVRNSLDPNPIEDCKWVRMVQKTSQYSYSVNRNPVEYEYRPSLTANSITYSTDATTYKTFNQFAIKIVLSAQSTVANSIPYVLDVRAIAMPEDVY